MDEACDDIYPPALGFMGWCRVSASLIGLSDDQRNDMLIDRDLGHAEWDAVNAHWLDKLVAGLARGDHSLADQYAAVCVAAAEGASQTYQDAPYLEVTAFLSEADLRAQSGEPALPFQGTSVPPPPMVIALPSQAAAGNTGPLDPDAIVVEATGAFARVPDASVDDVERYAMLVALIESASGDDRAAVHRQHAIDSEIARRTHDQRMGRAIRGRSDLQRRFEQRLHEWRAYKRKCDDRSCH